MFNTVLRFFRSGQRRLGPPRNLSKERRGHFFSWFNLEPDGEPKASGRDTWLSFRPSGSAFQALVRVDVMVRNGDRIVGSELWIDRSFIDGMQSSFARDIAAGFLSWALKDEETETKAALIANIGSISAANEPVIMRTDAAPPKPSADETGGYAVFTGHRELATFALGATDVTMRNGTSDDRSQKWLSIKIASTSGEHAS